MASSFDLLKRALVGRARASEEEDRTLLPRRMALPVFASDPVSSVAYAGQEVLVVLALGGAVLLALAPTLIVGVCVLAAIVVVAYGQVVRAYPGGGGSYAAASENLGRRAGAATAASLVVDYVLTVAVSAAAAAQTVAGLVGGFAGLELLLAVASVLLVMAVNLRGRREAGIAVMVPVYGFVVLLTVMLVVGFVRYLAGDPPVAASSVYEIDAEPTSGLAAALLLLRAFAGGGVAFAGVEAVANGTPAFRPPKATNAATTLLVLGAITVTLLLGTVVLTTVAGVRITADACDLVGYPNCETAVQEGVLSQLAGAVYGSGSIMIPIMAVATVGVLVAAANSAYNGFPLLAAVLAMDRYLPRQLAHRGDRLAYSNGIMFLSVAAIGVLLATRADIGTLLNLYLLGLLLSFTLAQTGMVRRWRHDLRRSTKRQRWQLRGRLALASLAATATGTVLVLSLVAKVPSGGWATLVAGVLVYTVMLAIRRHYDSVAAGLDLSEGWQEPMPARVHAIVLVSRIHKPVMRAVAYARATRPATLEAVTVANEPRAAAGVVDEWRRLGLPIPLRVLDSPYREITGPLMDHVASLRRRHPRDAVTVFVPEYVVGRWWEALLHNQSTLWLKSRLEAAPGVMVVSVPWRLPRAPAGPGPVPQGGALPAAGPGPR